MTQKAILKDPRIKALYEKFKRQRGGKKMMMMKGGSIWNDFVSFLKDSKILSSVADVALPTLGALGTSFISANPLAAPVGAAIGQSGADYIRSQGFGYRMTGGCHCKFRGGDSRLVINPMGQRLGQRR